MILLESTTCYFWRNSPAKIEILEKELSVRWTIFTATSIRSSMQIIISIRDFDREIGNPKQPKKSWVSVPTLVDAIRTHGVRIGAINSNATQIVPGVRNVITGSYIRIKIPTISIGLKVSIHYLQYLSFM